MGLVDEHGRITIDKAIRDELGIRAGDETVQHVEDGRIVIEVVPGRHRRLFASLADVADRPDDEPLASISDAASESPDPDRPER